MSKFRFSQRSLNNLKGVHPDLVAVVKLALELTSVDFVVIEGVRTVERQRKLKASGASQIMNSRHIPGEDGYGKAVDLAAWVDGEIRWDWPLYYKLAEAMKRAANSLDVAIGWGGDWKTFKDGPHFELSRKKYP